MSSRATAASLTLSVCFEGQTSQLRTCELPAFEKTKAARAPVIKDSVCKLTSLGPSPSPGRGDALRGSRGCYRARTSSGGDEERDGATGGGDEG